MSNIGDHCIYGIIVFIMTDQINELPEDGLKSSPETSRYTENKWISQKNQNKLYFLHLIDIFVLFDFCY